MTSMMPLISLAILLFHLAGIFSVISALMTARTPQGAIAWSMALVTFPYLAVPLYWIFGRNKFRGYIDARRQGADEIHEVTRHLAEKLPDIRSNVTGQNQHLIGLEALARMPFTHGNEARLLIDGHATFSAIFEAIERAHDYILVEFFILHDDQLGRDLKQHLLNRARAGLRIHVLYDEVGSHALPKHYLQELRDAGVDIRPFDTRKGVRNRLQLNFRNHRKIVIIDGVEAFVGGLNVGDEYMGRDPRFGPWRDTHAVFTGPCVTAVQVAFLEDWHWASGERLRLNWEVPAPREANQSILVLPSGPADPLETCSLFFVNALHAATQRIWIVSPYFVPDLDVISAIQSAALRGVEVRIMLPLKPDHRMVYLASFAYLAILNLPGIHVFRYTPGFLHQKVILIDDHLASVGTANADNRSFRLNFEITMVVEDRRFAREVETMLAKDFAQCREVDISDYEQRSLWFKLGVKFARLLSPIL